MLTRHHIPSFNVSDNTGQFKIVKKSYTQQFSQIYFARLQSLRPLIIKQAAGANYIGRVLDVQEGQECLIVGTIFCENIDRPNIFDEVENDQITALSRNGIQKYVTQAPLVCLEDESGRIELDISGLQSYSWVTGITIGIRGVADSMGKFKVSGVNEAGIPALPKCTPSTTDSYVAFVSGMHYGSEDGAASTARSLLVEFLNGDIFPEMAQKVCNLVLLGNTMSAPIKVSNEFKKKYGHEIARYRTDHLQHLDRELGSIASALNVTILPGEADLSTTTLPQKAVPKSLFPTLAANKSVNFTTNPTLIDVDTTKMLLSSGQNIDDVYRHVLANDRLEIAERCLHWRNIAPTCPDTLYCYPFVEKDPFILNEAPHVYAVGNQPQFGTKLIDSPSGSIRIVLVPEFSQSHSIVLINLRDLSVSELKLSI